MQSVANVIYPVECVRCGEPVTDEHGLCARCWSEMPFIGGQVCDSCGAPLAGDDEGTVEHCDECLKHPRPWLNGRAALTYREDGRKTVLQIKLSDRQDLVPAAARWMLVAARSILSYDMVIVPVPMHWTRLMSRGYNQSLELAREMARVARMELGDRTIIKPRRTEDQTELSPEARRLNQFRAFEPHPKHGAKLAGRKVLLVDDVFTTGATLEAATEACLSAGATQVSVVTLARAAREP